MSPFSRIPALLLLAAAAIASPLHLRPATRVTAITDVASDFESKYKSAASCPTSVKISNAALDKNTNIFSVPDSDIVENGAQCPEGGLLVLLSEENYRRAGMLQNLKFFAAAAALPKNANALAVLNAKRAKRTNMLVGFDSGGSRTCGPVAYPTGTFYFFIRETGPVALDLKDPAGKPLSISLPPQTRALLIVDPANRVCLLADPSTGGNVPAVVRTPPPAPITPTPSASPSPPASAGTALPTLPIDPESAAPAPTGEAGAPSGPNTPAVVGEPTPSPADALAEEPTNGGGGGSVCFPAHATVELASGARVPMASLRIGDRVRTGPASFSDVFLFTHRDAAVRARFVRLVSAAGPAVTLTKSHYLYANGALVSAGSVRRGDVLRLADGRDSAVAAIEDISSNGLYNPQTVDGNIVVDGVVASAYTTAVHPRVAHGALLAPLRFLYARSRAALPALDALAGLISGRADALSRVVPAGPAGLA